MQILHPLIWGIHLLQKSIRSDAECIIVVATDYQFAYEASVILDIERDTAGE